MKILESYKKGSLTSINHLVMAPMTRARNPKGIFNSLNAEYYAQRAGKSGAGIIVTEGVAISPSSKGVLYVPGIYTPEMISGAKLVTDAVHEKGGKIFVQLWHVGRISHTSLLDGNSPLGASDIAAPTAKAYAYDENGNATYVNCSVPKALLTTEVKQVIMDFANAAENAVAAGFDGIEIHGANGYLVEQFLNPILNNRTDEYGGSIENRAKLLLEIVDAIAAKIGVEKVGVRLSPYGELHDIPAFDEVEEVYQYVAHELDKRSVTYIHLMNQTKQGQYVIPETFLQKLRTWYSGSIILAGGLDKVQAEDLLTRGIIDLAGFGVPLIGNPDLAERFKNDWPLNKADGKTFYGGAEIGYTDYPTYQPETQNI
ncbi:alkene reductase [Pedobacter sp. AW1-32]|uniref:alkene reductase n=1 Tax=Pedobacter sp. AW1-32 TaxID=3383026 RepID=UPI003FF0BA73